LNEYLETEKEKRTYLWNAYFEKNKNEYAPIPQSEIDMLGNDKNGDPF